MQGDAEPATQLQTRQLLDDFRDALAAEEAMAIAALAKDNLGILLRGAINEFDWYYYNLRRTEEPSPEQELQFYILQLGINRIVKLALESRPHFDVPVIMFPRDPELTARALGFLSGLGFIEHGRRVADSVAI